jgi:hypothetical protein
MTDRALRWEWDRREDSGHEAATFDVPKRQPARPADGGHADLSGGGDRCPGPAALGGADAATGGGSSASTAMSVAGLALNNVPGDAASGAYMLRIESGSGAVTSYAVGADSRRSSPATSLA